MIKNVSNIQEQRLTASNRKPKNQQKLKGYQNATHKLLNFASHVFLHFIAYNKKFKRKHT